MNIKYSFNIKSFLLCMNTMFGFELLRGNWDTMGKEVGGSVNYSYCLGLHNGVEFSL